MLHQQTHFGMQNADAIAELFTRYLDIVMKDPVPISVYVKKDEIISKKQWIDSKNKKEKKEYQKLIRTQYVRTSLFDVLKK